MIKDDSGKPLPLIGVNLDITERKQVEERLRQAQTLESLGLLAGGIAHDFNNLLTVIIGNADFARTKYPSSEELKHIITASDRAAHHTSELLAYAGKGQFICTTFSLNDVVSGSEGLLSVSVPKAMEVSLALGLSEVLTSDISRMGLVLYSAIGLGQELLRPATRTKKVATRCHTSPGVQMDPHSVPLLEAQRTV